MFLYFFVKLPNVYGILFVKGQCDLFGDSVDTVLGQGAGDGWSQSGGVPWDTSDHSGDLVWSNTGQHGGEVTVVENGFSNFDWVGFGWVSGLEQVVLGHVSSDIRDVDTQFNQVDSFVGLS